MLQNVALFDFFFVVLNEDEIDRICGTVLLFLPRAADAISATLLLQ
jgi:hypothetical protein